MTKEGLEMQVLQGRGEVLPGARAREGKRPRVTEDRAGVGWGRGDHDHSPVHGL